MLKNPVVQFQSAGFLAGWVAAVLTAASSTGGSAAPSGPHWVGRYTSAFSGEEGRGTAVLELRSDFTAVMTLRYHNVSRDFLQTGKWAALPYQPASRLLITFKKPRRENMILELREGDLVAIIYDPHKYGKGGLRFSRGGLGGGRPPDEKETESWEGTYRRSFTESRGSGEMILQLQRKGSAVMTITYEQGAQPPTQTGTWQVRGNRLTVTLNSSGNWKGKERPRPEFLVLERQGPDLIAVDWDREKYGREALHFIRLYERAEDWIGTYRRSFRESRGWVEVTLEIKRDRKAVLTTTYEGERKTVKQTGGWTLQQNQLTVNLDRQNGRKIRETLVLRRQGAELVAVDWDRQKHGREALRFTPIPGPRGGWGNKSKER